MTRSSSKKKTLLNGSAIKDYQCIECSLSFTKEAYYKHKQRFHKNLQTNLCDKCNKSFKSQKELEIHFARKHTERSTWKLQCFNCGKNQPHVASLRDHIKRCSKKANCSLHKLILDSNEPQPNMKVPEAAAAEINDLELIDFNYEADADIFSSNMEEFEENNNRHFLDEENLEQKSYIEELNREMLNYLILDPSII